MLTTVGQITRLTLERYWICEFFAELLHCSNMSVLNRPPEYDELYDEQDRLRDGLAALEGLAQVISLNQTGDRERGPIETIEDEVDPLWSCLFTELHVSPVFSSDEEMSSDEEPGSSDEDATEEIAMFDEPQSMSPAQEPSPLPPSSASPPESSPPENPFSPPPPERTPPGTPLARTASRSQDLSPSQSRFHGSRRSSRRTLSVVPEIKLCIGEKLKRCFIDLNVLTTFLVRNLCSDTFCPRTQRHCCIGPLFRAPMEQSST